MKAYALIKSILGITILFCGFSCNIGGASTQDNISLSDSTVNDSAKIKIDPEQEKIAFGSYRFGMTKKQCDKLPKKETEYIQKIGLYEYTLHTDFTDSNILYKIELNGYVGDASNLDTHIQEYTENLKDVITTKYGTPSLDKSYPSVLDFTPGYIKWVYGWDIGKKLIRLGVGQNDNSATFYSICWIYDRELNEAIENKENKKGEQLKSADASKF